MDETAELATGQTRPRLGVSRGSLGKGASFGAPRWRPHSVRPGWSGLVGFDAVLPSARSNQRTPNSMQGNKTVEVLSV
jgi:hypothetical protein